MDSAKCLYLTVMTGNAEARQQFSQNEIAVDKRRLALFHRRLAAPHRLDPLAGGLQHATPAAARIPTGKSDIQSGNPTTDHDPFDPHRMRANAFQLTPLIVSSAGHTMSGNSASTITASAFDTAGPSVYKTPVQQHQRRAP